LNAVPLLQKSSGNQLVDPSNSLLQQLLHNPSQFPYDSNSSLLSNEGISSLGAAVTRIPKKNNVKIPALDDFPFPPFTIPSVIGNPSQINIGLFPFAKHSNSKPQNENNSQQAPPTAPLPQAGPQSQLPSLMLPADIQTPSQQVPLEYNFLASNNTNNNTAPDPLGSNMLQQLISSGLYMDMLM